MAECKARHMLLSLLLQLIARTLGQANPCGHCPSWCSTSHCRGCFSDRPPQLQHKGQQRSGSAERARGNGGAPGLSEPAGCRQ